MTWPTYKVTIKHVNTPLNQQEALASENAEDWQQAINSEIASLEANQTWEVMPLPTGKQAIPSKWIFKVKRGSRGKIERFKARLVVKGYAQRLGIDF